LIPPCFIFDAHIRFFNYTVDAKRRA
jgi:hypothetical protein